MKKLFIILFLLFDIPFSFYAQVAINIDGSEAASSSLLDVKSTSKGVLIPRMTANERDYISSPARGLLVYVTTDNKFYYYSGTTNGWIPLSTVKSIDDLTDAKSDSDGSNNGSSVFIGTGAGYTDDESDNRNVGIGYYALNKNNEGFQNTAVGYKALSSNTTGMSNVAIGFQSLSTNDIGLGNVAMGYFSLGLNSSGSHNIALGTESLFWNNTGSCNVAIGLHTLYSNKEISNLIAIGDSALYNNGSGASGPDEGHRNTAIGSKALYSNTTGRNNTACGYKTLKYNTTGYYNTAFGIYALINNDDGYRNTAIGGYTLHENTSGYRNTALGYYAFFDGTAYHNSTALGYSTVIKASDQIRLGNSLVKSIGGYDDWTKITDKRFTKDVKENVPGMALIRKLRPVTYHLDMEAVSRWEKMPEEQRMPEDERQKAEEVQIGFIPQEVEKAAEELGFDFHAVDKPKNKDDRYGLRYAEFVPVLVKALQEQEKTIDKLSQRIEVLENKLNGK
jgi:hypothetical protein